MAEPKPPFGRVLIAGVVGVSTLLPWYDRIGQSNAWSASLRLDAGTSIPFWLVFPLAAFSVAISWGGHRRWHDLPKSLPALLDSAAVLLALAGVLVGRPGTGTALGLLAATALWVTDGTELLFTRPAVPLDSARRSIDRLGWIRIRRRNRERARSSSVHRVSVTPAAPAPDGAT